MTNWIRFTDSKSLSNVNLTSAGGDPLKLKDAYLSGDLKVLRVTFAATHAGIITRNNGLYLPGKMREGIKSWLTPYAKPIQVHHEDETDPIGRAVYAEYVDTIHKINPAFQDKIAKFDWSIKDFSTGKYPIHDQRKVIYDLQDIGLLEDPEWQGLGYTKLVFDVTDPEAIQKFLDGRYLTGSVGVSTNSASCSIRDCGLDWASADGPCDHKPGKTVDGKKMFLIAGDLKNEEYSVVNGPADPFAQKLKLEWLNKTVDMSPRDSAQHSDIVPELTSSNDDVINIIDSTQEEIMKLNSATIKSLRNEVQTHAADMTAELETFLDRLAEYVTTHALTDARLTELTKLVDQIHTEDLTELVKMFDGVTEVTQELADKFADAVLELEWNSFADGDSDEAWEDMLKDLPLLRDAKLTSEQRKKMGSSTFCGPNRSFPVPDCAHVVAARRLIGRAKQSAATKSRILSCVSRKAKGMGCTGSEKDFVQPEVIVDTKSELDLATLTVDQLQDLRTKVTGLLIEKGVADTTATELETLRNSVAELTKTSTDLQTKVTEQTDSLKYLRQELKMAYEDITSAEDRLINTLQDRRTDLLSQARTLIALRDKKKLEEVDLAELADKDFVSVKNTVTQLADSLDITKIIDKLDDGMARQPVGTVDPPTGVKVDEGKEKITRDDYETRKTLMHKSGGMKAVNVFDSWVKNHAVIVE